MLKFIFIFSLLATNSFAQDNAVFFYGDFEFEQGSEQMLYGDNVVFRKKPDAKSMALDTLAICSKVTILKKTKEKMMYQGIERNWYKVDHDGKIGYVLGGLISLTSVEVDGHIYLASIIDKGDYDRSLRYRMVKSGTTGGTSFLSGELSLETSAFSLDIFDDRGVEGVDHILYINYYAEACGVNGGGVYLFYDGEQLVKAMNISSVADGGVFWFSEDLIFPDDEKGEEGYIIYEREHGESMDENVFWDRTVSHRVYLKWENGKFTPDVSELDFGDH